MAAFYVYVCVSKCASVHHGPLCAICCEQNWKPHMVSCHFCGFVLNLVCFSTSEVHTNGVFENIINLLISVQFAK